MSNAKVTVCFSAYGKQGRVVADSPAQAARGYFERFPSSRKCTVVEGHIEGGFFVTSYGGGLSYGYASNWPQSFRDVTRKTLESLPV